MPKRFWAPGVCIAGDGASMCNVTRLKGIHYSMHAGMFAAEAIFEALKKGDTSDLSLYEEKVRNSEIETDFYKTRNQRQVFAKGFFLGGALANAMEISGGRFPGGRFKTHDDSTVDVFIGKRHKKYPKPDGKLTFDKLSSVFATGNATRDDAPNHIRIQENVPLELALMWQNMCPAQVYEVPEEIQDELAKNGEGSLDPKQLVNLHVTPSNCVQCGAITAKGGRLTPPEGGDGPNYQIT
jgi:electron-transferring-flavoprotein dehydrogenase